MYLFDSRNELENKEAIIKDLKVIKAKLSVAVERRSRSIEEKKIT